MESSPPDMEAYRRLTRQFQYGRPSQIPSQRQTQSQLQSQRPNYPWRQSNVNSQRSQSSNFQTVPSQSQILSQYSSQRYQNQSQSLFAKESEFRSSQPQRPKTPEIEKKEIATQTTPRRMARLYDIAYINIYTRSGSEWI